MLWTAEEIAQLEELVAEERSNAEIALILGRSYEAVKSRVVVTGLSQRVSRADRPWLPEEDHRLRALRAERWAVAGIASDLGRTAWSITNRIRKLGLARLEPRDPVERFWEKVDRRGPGECWPWLGATDRKGYGAFAVGGHRRGTASRWAWIFTHGDPGDLHVCHRCDSPPCCNPAHLFLGTNRDNITDRIAKRRTRNQFMARPA